MEKSVIVGENLTLGYGTGAKKKRILSDINFSLKKGEMTCLLGPNGVGKSTLVRGVLGQIAPWKGTVKIKGKNVQAIAPKEMAKTLAVVLTDPFLSGNMTVQQLVSLGRIPHTQWHGKLLSSDYDAISNAIRSTKIEELKDERLSEISDGQRQKAMIARALAQDGEIMILDEPTAHLDLINRFEIMNLLSQIAKNQDKALLVVSHNLEIALDTAQQFWILEKENSLLSGTPEDLILSGEINRLIPNDKFHFNLEKGKLETNSLESNLIIEGSKKHTFWVEKALHKAGIFDLSEKISLRVNPFQLIFDDQKFTQIEALIDYIQGK